jgi:hypothetical protein
MPPTAEKASAASCAGKGISTSGLIRKEKPSISESNEVGHCFAIVALVRVIHVIFWQFAYLPLAV